MDGTRPPGGPVEAVEAGGLGEGFLWLDGIRWVIIVPIGFLTALERTHKIFLLTKLEGA